MCVVYEYQLIDDDDNNSLASHSFGGGCDPFVQRTVAVILIYSYEIARRVNAYELLYGRRRGGGTVDDDAPSKSRYPHPFIIIIHLESNRTIVLGPTE